MLDSPLVTDLIKLAIEEDLAGGDVTSDLTIPEDHQSQASFLAKEEMIVCGMPILEKLFAELHFPLKLSVLIKDGELVKSGAILAILQGKTRHILSAERLALNFLQHLSGIATLTHKVVKDSGKLKILDTRKTTPGLRIFEKYAVKTGGGQNHRMNLGDMILVKNNHIDAHGNLETLLKDLYANKPEKLPIEIEIRNMQELKTAMEFKPTLIMLDNMDNEQVKEAIGFIRSKHNETMVEVSGGITEARLMQLSDLGVNYVSMGMLTNKAQSVDISLRIKTI